MKLLIVGGVAGGASAAARSRRLSEDAEIVLIERGPDVSFANCGLPYYLGGEITDREKLLVVTPERLRSRFKLDVRVRTSAEAIDRSAKKVHLRDLTSGREYEETYDKLILAPGAAPLKPPIPGIDLPGIFTLRNLQDMDRIKQKLDQGVRQAVVVGAGFIGLELVENFVRLGIATTVVELQDQVLPPFDKEMTTPIAEHLAAKGVSLLLGQSAEAFEQTPDGLIVRLKSGERLPAQLVSLGVGVRPENKLAVDAGLEVGPRGGIRVNEHLQTSDPDIYAVGDAIEVKDFVTGEPTQVKWRKDRQAELQWLEDVNATYLYSSAWTNAGKTKMVAEGSGVIPLGYVAGPCSAPWGLSLIGERGVCTIVVLRERDSDESIELKKRSLTRLFPEAKIWIGSKSADCHIW